MILIEKTNLIRFDDEAERERIQTAFSSKSRSQDREELLAILDAFVAGDLARCYSLILVKDRQWLEYVNETILDVISGVHEQFTKQAKAIEFENKVAGGEINPPAEPIAFGRGLEVVSYPKYTLLAEGKDPVPATVPTISEMALMLKDKPKEPK